MPEPTTADAAPSRISDAEWSAVVHAAAAGGADHLRTVVEILVFRAHLSAEVALLDDTADLLEEDGQTSLVAVFGLRYRAARRRAYVADVQNLTMLMANANGCYQPAVLDGIEQCPLTRAGAAHAGHLHQYRFDHPRDGPRVGQATCAGYHTHRCHTDQRGDPGCPVHNGGEETDPDENGKGG